MFIEDLINYIFSLQEKILKRKYKKISLSASHSMVKNHMQSGVELIISNELDKNRKKVRNEVEAILKENIDNINNILKYPLNFNVKTYVIKNADKFLKLIDEKEGFIFPKKGIYALYINFLTEKKISFKSEPLFIFNNDKISSYKLIYEFYIWYSYKMNLPGFEEKTREKYKNIFDYEKDEKLNELNYIDIVCLQNAIERDKDAMEFTLEFIKNLEGSKNVFNIIKKDDKGANI